MNGISSPTHLTRFLILLSCAALGSPIPGVAAGEPPAPADPPSNAAEDFTGMDLEKLMAVKVPVIYSASKHEQKATDAPSSVTVVTREDIQEYGFRTMAEVLDGVRGFYTIFDRGYYYLGSRGVNRLGDFGGRSLIMIDGHRLNDPVYESAALGLDFPLDVDLIERVEVIRGPGSSLYGNNAFFDVINVVTRSGHQLDGQGMEAATSYGSFDAFSGRFTYGGSFTNGVELLVSCSYFSTDGAAQLAYPSASASGFPGVIQRGNDGQTARNFFASVAYNGITLEAVYGRRDAGLANGPYGAVFNDNRNQAQDERAYLEARLVRELSPDWQLQARTYIDRYAYDGSYVDDYAHNGVLTLNRDAPRAGWAGAELQLSGTVWEKHRLTFGTEGRYDFEQRQNNYDVSPAYVYINESHSSESGGLYLQDEFRVLERLTLNAGLRGDYFSSFGGTINPRLGVIYQPWDGTTWKALYGQAFRAPNAYEQDYHGLGYDANHDLRPETIRSGELVWEQALAQNYRLTGTLFYEVVDSLIAQEVNAADGNLIFRNNGGANVEGAEAELEARWEHGLRSRISYAYASAVNDVTGETLANSPRHLAKFHFTFPLYPPKLFAGIELLGTSAVTTGQGARLPASVIANLNLFTREIVKGLEVSASIDNLFNRQYYNPTAPGFAQDLIPQDGRTFRLKATYRF